VEKGGEIVIGVAYEGKLAQNLPNGMNANEIVSLEGRSKFDFEDGKIARIVDYS
jgi:hypothetical protein